MRRGFIGILTAVYFNWKLISEIPKDEIEIFLIITTDNTGIKNIRSVTEREFSLLDAN